MPIPEPVALVAAGSHQVLASDETARPLSHRRVAALRELSKIGRVSKKSRRNRSRPLPPHKRRGERLSPYSYYIMYAVPTLISHLFHRLRSADGTGCPVKPVTDSVGGYVDTLEWEHLSLGTHETVVALIVGEPVLVVRMISRLSQ